MSDSEDDLVTYGTPLEPLEEDEIPKKRPCLIEDQVATDKQGRRVFHGAFTGGFSAGFFNTVGSLEGWKPSSFKSSRSDKQKLLHQRPEDFMDEEDFDEFGIAPRVLKARKDYANESETPDSFLRNPNLGKYVLKDLLKPARETVGIKLLKKMGWKPGQGVGPRVTTNEKKNTLKIRQKIYGCMLPSEMSEEQEDQDSDSEWADIKYAPDDYEPFLFAPKDNYCGIGYEGLDKGPVLSSGSSENYKSKERNRNSRISSQAFGVGAFEEEDDDIYSKDDMTRYDFSLGGDSNQESKVNSPEKVDGVLDGFVLGVKKVVKKYYALPLLPKNFVPQHGQNSSKSDFASLTGKKKTSRWDMTEVENCDKTQKKSNLVNEKNTVLSSEKVNEDIELKQTEELISDVKIKTSSFKPFMNNPDKQNRYEKYLKLIEVGKKDFLKKLQPITMTEWDKERERVEFEKAALLFKPLTGVMEDRFLSASQPDDISDPLATVEKFQDQKDDRAKAAKMNMYGPLTRIYEEWTPCSLLCKRFNIPEPKMSSVQSISKKPVKYSLFDCLDDVLAQEKAKETVPEKTTNVSHSSQEQLKEHSPDVVEKSDVTKKTENQSKSTENDPLTSQVKADLFKAIFLDSDEEDESEASKETSNNENLPGKELERELLYEEKILNLRRNDSPPRGIFENIDLESLGKRPGGSTSNDVIEIKSKVVKEPSKNEMEVPDDLVYGPKIPEKISAPPTRFVVEKVTNDSCWVEKKSHKKKKKKKSEKEKKSHHHKSKHKHKKNKR